MKNRIYNRIAIIAVVILSLILSEKAEAQFLGDVDNFPVTYLLKTKDNLFIGTDRELKVKISIVNRFTGEQVTQFPEREYLNVKSNRFGYFTVHYGKDLKGVGATDGFNEVRQFVNNWAIKIQVQSLAMGDAETGYRVLGYLALMPYLESVKTLSTMVKPTLNSVYNDKGTEGNTITVTEAGEELKINSVKRTNTVFLIDHVVPASSTTANIFSTQFGATNNSSNSAVTTIDVANTAEAANGNTVTSAAISASVIGDNNLASAVFLQNAQGYAIYVGSGATRLGFTALENGTTEIPANATYVKIADDNVATSFTIKNIVTSQASDNAGRILYITKSNGFAAATTIATKTITSGAKAVVMIFDGTNWNILSEK